MRKRLAGDGSADYIGIARNLLAQLRQSMALNGLKVGQRAIDLDGGVRIVVKSVFGNDEMLIYAPPETAVPLIDEALEAANSDPEYVRREATNAEVLTVGDTLTLTITTYDNVDIGGPGSSSGTNDIIQVGSSVRLTIVTTTYPAAYVPPPKPPEIFVAGHKISNNPNGYTTPFLWDDVNGLRLLGLRSTFGRDEPTGAVRAISDDGSVPVGWVKVRDISLQSAQQLRQRAAAWRNGTGDADVVAWVAGRVNEDSDARIINAAKTVVNGTWGSGGFGKNFAWDGKNNTAFSNIGALSFSDHPNSANGRVKTSSNKYQLDNGAWISFGNGDYVATCAAHVPYTAPTPPNQSPTVKTTVLVFSG